MSRSPDPPLLLYLRGKSLDYDVPAKLLYKPGGESGSEFHVGDVVEKFNDDGPPRQGGRVCGKVLWSGDYYYKVSYGVDTDAVKGMVEGLTGDELTRVYDEV